MRMRRAITVVIAALVFVGGACSEQKDAKPSPFEITGLVRSTDTRARPVNDPTNSDVTGLVLLREDTSTGFEECASDVSGVSVFVEAHTSFTPAAAKDDLNVLAKKTVRSTGRLTKGDNDVCTAIADSMAVEGADEPSPES